MSFTVLFRDVLNCFLGHVGVGINCANNFKSKRTVFTLVYLSKLYSKNCVRWLVTF